MNIENNTIYSFNTPEEAIISLEKAYSNEDIKGVLISKDFENEAKLTLKKAKIEVNRDTIKETVEILKLSLIKALGENGFPDFRNSTRWFSDLKEIDESLFIINEIIEYENGEKYSNQVYISFNKVKWKVVMIEES